jgi:glycerate kinase
LVVAQAFKETLTPEQVAEALSGAVRGAGLDPIVVRGSDGGDGLLDALDGSLQRRTAHAATDPLGRPIRVEVGSLDSESAVIESRLVCGLALLAIPERNPLHTSTRGLGSLIAEVASAGARSVYVGLGGSATMDGGVGMARAWGFVPRAASGKELDEGGGALSELERIDGGEPPAARIVGLCDVRSPLVGPQGARLYARQKGATPDAENRLEAGLRRLVEVTAGQELAGQDGAGAAGGLGFGLLHFGAGELVAGAPWVLERLGFDELLQGAAMVVTGEGAFDRTSLEGKLTGEVLSRARAADVPAVLLAPQAADVPGGGVVVESGGGRWSAADLARRAHSGIARALRLLGQ